MQSDDQHLRGRDNKVRAGVSQEEERLSQDMVPIRPLHHPAPPGQQIQYHQ